MTFLKLINNYQKLPLYGTTIYADDVQLLFSVIPNNLEPLKIYAETSLKTMKELVQWKWFENAWIQIKPNAFFLQHQNWTNGLRRFK